MIDFPFPCTTPPIIAIVDDDPGMLQLMADLLLNEAYLVRTYTNGLDAVQSILKDPPDLILLDVMMPEMDGFEVCRQIMLNQTTRYIPVIFITCLDDKQTRLKGIEAGASDFINKPVDVAEIRLRTRNLLLVKQYHDFLREHAELLEQKVQLRTKELEKALADLTATQAQLIQHEKMAAIGQLTAGIAHEISTPISFVSSNVTSLKKYCEKLTSYLDINQKLLAVAQLDPAMSEQLEETRSKMKIDHIIADIPEMISETIDGVERIQVIAKDLKCYSRLDIAERTVADLNKCLDSTLNVVRNELKYKATVTKEYGELPGLLCYPQQLGQVFLNLLVNAAHAIEGMGAISIRTRVDGDFVEVVIRDSGCGIPEDIRSKIFEAFFTTKEYGKGTGLGLSISTQIIHKHGGTISVESEVGAGTAFTVRLPLTPPVIPEGGQEVTYRPT